MTEDRVQGPADIASLPKNYDAAASEARWRKEWERLRIFERDISAPRDRSFVVDSPPPTVSGSLHMGHVFSYTHQDINVRYRRMCGWNICYPMGWDDNGLPTERRVQNYFNVRAEPGAPYEPGLKLEPAHLHGALSKSADRDARPRIVSRQSFIEMCHIVTSQDEVVFRDLFQRLGLSIDWREEYATIDDRCRRIAQRSFIDLLHKGHVYQVEAPTMWDVDFQTAVAQAEVEDREKSGAFHNIEFAVAPASSPLPPGSRLTPSHLPSGGVPTSSALPVGPGPTSSPLPSGEGQGEGETRHDNPVKERHPEARPGHPEPVEGRHHAAGDGHPEPVDGGHRAARSGHPEPVEGRHHAAGPGHPEPVEGRPTAANPRASFIISTTRPELLAACVGVAAHPDDPRYKDLIGRYAITPVFFARVPIFASKAVDPAKGTGILMVCTFGDQSDVEWWREHNLQLRQVVGRDGRILPRTYGTPGWESLAPDRANENYSKLTGKRLPSAKAAVVEMLRDASNSALRPTSSPVPPAERPISSPLPMGEGQGEGETRHAEPVEGRLPATGPGHPEPVELGPISSPLPLGEGQGEGQSRHPQPVEGRPPLQTEPIAVLHSVRYYEKGESPLEYLTTRQWFVKLSDKKQLLLDMGRRITWRPDYMLKRYENWVENLNTDWCISRQRYFGVPIPVWYPLDARGQPVFSKAIVASPDQLPVDPMSQPPPGYAEDRRGKPGGFTGEPDVFDTWFTSSLTPQIVARWGDADDQMASLFPMDVRPQAHDIIRTWAFYTIVKAAFHQSDVPWRNIILSGWILDPDRKKMSKSKGNVVTPAHLLDQFGADSVRYWAGSARLGADTAFDEQVFKVGKRLVTKVFNAGKFVLAQTPADATVSLAKDLGREVSEAAHPQPVEGGDKRAATRATRNAIVNELDLAFIAELRDVVRRATEALEDFEFAQALEITESFFWSGFTDNYIELVKARAKSETDPAGRASAIATLRLGLSTFLRLFAPFTPNICDEVWSWAFAAETGVPSVHVAPWPNLSSPLPLRERARVRGDDSRPTELGGGHNLLDVPAPVATDLFQVACKAISAFRKAKTDAGLGLGAPIAGDTTLHVTQPDILVKWLEPVLSDVASAAGTETARISIKESLIYSGAPIVATFVQGPSPI